MLKLAPANKRRVFRTVMLYVACLNLIGIMQIVLAILLYLRFPEALPPILISTGLTMFSVVSLLTFSYYERQTHPEQHVTVDEIKPSETFKEYN